ncbi:hypothetical protein EBZ39_16840, partial [bacterium]|nr:hypothetical protein [bacterium]
SYTYWIKDGSPSLIVEAFAPSKPLEAFGKLYDPTLRMAFVMSNLHGRMSLTYVGSYWKLPEKSLQEAGTMIEKHKSAITRNHACSYKVADEDFSAVAEQLNQLLPSLYEEMLQQSV